MHASPGSGRIQVRVVELGIEQVPSKESVSVCRLARAICAVKGGVEHTHLS